jgi:hypothetical protein
MQTPNAAVLGKINTMVKESNKARRPLIIITEGIHSKHYAFATDVTKDFVAFTTLEGESLLVPWDTVNYLGLVPTPLAQT